jgi:D-glycero-alpha-D-manno-heptose-7-phosphate kinase
LIATEGALHAYKTAMAAGALGGKITGAGGGGYMLFYAPFERRFEVAEELRKAKFEVLDISLDEMGMESWTDG